MMISILIPVYNEKENIIPLIKSLYNVLTKLSVDYEIVFVDDGSIDGSYEQIKKLRENDDKIRVIKLRRNFG